MTIADFFPDLNLYQRAKRLLRRNEDPLKCEEEIDVAGAVPAFTGWGRLALLAGFALLVIFRLPQAWLQGRFLGEEGAVFFAFAWHQPASTALFRSFGGYINIAANASTLLDAKLVRAGYLPLESAPYLTMVVALLFQMIPAVLILTGRGRWLANRSATVAGLMILAISPMTEEVFGNVLHIQFHLALCAALILALDVPRSHVGRIVYWGLLLLAPLCGPGAMVLLPLFALRSLIDQDVGRWAQTAVITAGTALQLFLFFTASPVRGHFLDPASLLAVIFVRLVALPLITPPLADKLGKFVYASYRTAGSGWWFAAAGSLAYSSTLIRLALRDRRDPAIWLILSGLVIVAVSFGGGMIASDPRELFTIGAGERYNFLPLTLLSLGLVALATRPSGDHRRVCACLCLLTLFSGAISYSRPREELRQGPAWTGQVAAWRRNHDYRLEGWPKTWSIDLSDRDQPCSSPRRSKIPSPEPSYCENAWLQHQASAKR